MSWTRAQSSCLQHCALPVPGCCRRRGLRVRGWSCAYLVPPKREDTVGPVFLEPLGSWSSWHGLPTHHSYLAWRSPKPGHSCPDHWDLHRRCPPWVPTNLVGGLESNAQGGRLVHKLPQGVPSLVEASGLVLRRR